MSAASSGRSSRSPSGSAGTAWERAARAGYAVSGLLHLLLGFFIVRIALGDNEDADQGSALSRIGESPLGTVGLWGAAVALVALATWQAADAVRSHDKTSERLVSAGRAVVYLAIGVLAATIALGARDSGGDSQVQDFTGTLMEAPAGRLLVGAVGLGLIAAGVVHCVVGLKRRFLEHLRTPSSRRVATSVRWLGAVGYTAKGVALAVMGGLFTYAALTADPSEAQGIDGTIDSLLGAPGGPVIVMVVGLGFGAYGLYLFARARYDHM